MLRVVVMEAESFPCGTGDTSALLWHKAPKGSGVLWLMSNIQGVCGLFYSPYLKPCNFAFHPLLVLSIIHFHSHSIS